MQLLNSKDDTETVITNKNIGYGTLIIFLILSIVPMFYFASISQDHGQWEGFRILLIIPIFVILGIATLWRTVALFKNKQKNLAYALLLLLGVLLITILFPMMLVAVIQNTFY